MDYEQQWKRSTWAGAAKCAYYKLGAGGGGRLLFGVLQMQILGCRRQLLAT